MKKTNRLRYLFGRYVSNTCSRRELGEFFDYVEDARHDDHLKNVLDELWHKGGNAVQADDSYQPAAVSSYWKWAVAASVSVVAILAFGMFFWRVSDNVPAEGGGELVQRVSKSTFDERRMITLPDGSAVWINSDSKLDYPLEFSNGVREVRLTGEAFFDIQKDTLRPFIIYSGKVTTLVLGTAFNIRAFPEENAVTVTVARGKVMVRDDEKHERILEANQQISFSELAPAPVPQAAEADSVSGWTQQDLVLDNITFREAATVIENRYSVNVEFTNEALNGCRFTSTFLHGASLEQMLTAICIVNRATFTVSDSTVVISGEGCER